MNTDTVMLPIAKRPSLLIENKQKHPALALEALERSAHAGSG
jgi:hypothetical protein